MGSPTTHKKLSPNISPGFTNKPVGHKEHLQSIANAKDKLQAATYILWACVCRHLPGI